MTLASWTDSTEQLDSEQEQNEWRLDPKRFSSWLRLLRVRARVRRALFNMRMNVQRRIEQELTPGELGEAEVKVIRTAQWDSFGEEYRNLTAAPVQIDTIFVCLCKYSRVSLL